MKVQLVKEGFEDFRQFYRNLRDQDEKFELCKLMYLMIN